MDFVSLLFAKFGEGVCKMKLFSSYLHNIHTVFGYEVGASGISGHIRSAGSKCEH